MKEQNLSPLDFENDLKRMSEQGIGVDLKRIKEDLCAQFTDYREWIREYVVNAYDAGAGYCHISGFEQGGTITIIVEDNVPAWTGSDCWIHDYLPVTTNPGTKAKWWDGTGSRSSLWQPYRPGRLRSVDKHRRGMLASENRQPLE